MSFNIIDVYLYLLLIVLAGGMGVVCGLLSYFLDYCFWPESIFKWYLPWLGKVVMKRSDPVMWKAMKYAKPEAYIPLIEGKFWFKILGGCSVCFNIWLALISWTVICIVSPFAWYYGFPYIMVSSWMIRKLMGAV